MTPNPSRPVGEVVSPLPPGRLPDGRILSGRYVRLEPVSVSRHGSALYGSFANSDPDGSVWTYMGYGPFGSQAEFVDWLKTKENSRDPFFYAFVPLAGGEAVGMGSFMRPDPPNGVIEIGHIWFSPGLQRTREATEIIFLMMRHAFDDLGVRRLEWKCDALNAPSRRAAERFGFSFEGVFRQHMIVKKRNRDTAWYALLDHEWPAIRAGFEKWLEESNFDKAGRQLTSLARPG
jgi:RimJ/RimL family protein N-acetyltransferase